MSAAAKVLRFKNAEVPRQQGEVGRLRVLKGTQDSMIFVLKDSSVTVGRGEECDVMINDIKASRKHVRIDYTKEGWLVTDLGSANGIFYHGEYVRKCHLQSGQHFAIGDTVVEFFAGSEGTQVLMAPARPIAEVMQMDQAYASQRVRVLHSGQAVKVAPSKKKSNPLVRIALIGMIVYNFQEEIVDFLADVDELKPYLKDWGLLETPQRKKRLAKKKAEETQPVKPPDAVDAMSAEVGKTAEQYYRQGFREFRQGNYLRAKAQYELALQVNPAHEMARKGLENAEHEIEAAIKISKASGRKAREAGRLREAKGYYEAAQRLMYFDRANPEYIEAEEELKEINDELSKGY